MDSVELQKLFFQNIKIRIPEHVSQAEEVAELLGISTDSAYRRIRGEKPISFQEIQKLCSHYKMSLDQFLSIDSNSTIFFGNWLDGENFNFENYLADMHKQLIQISRAGKKLLYFEAKDIPLFHHLQLPDLASFKYFFWMKTILSYPKFNKISFEDCDLNKTLSKTGIDIIKEYNKIPSIEIWSADTINSTINQIEFYKESGVFKKKESIEILYDQLLKLILHIEKEAEVGKKFLINEDENENSESFQLFWNEVFLGHNSIMTETDNSQTVFINHGVLNYMITRDVKFCENTKKGFENTMRKSSLISSVNEKERQRFFNILKEKISRKSVNV